MTWSSTHLFVFSKLSWCYQLIKLWFYVLIRNQATDHMAVHRVAQQTNSFLEIVAVFVAQLQHCAILRPFFWYYRPAVFTPKSMTKMLKRTIFLHINALKAADEVRIWLYADVMSTSFGYNLGWASVLSVMTALLRQNMWLIAQYKWPLPSPLLPFTLALCPGTIGDDTC